MQFPPDESAPIRPWLVASRPPGASPRLIIVHATRGANTQAAQYSATRNWFNSDANRGRNPDGSPADWGGSAHLVIGHDGRLCRFIDDAHTAHYSAGFGSKPAPLGWSADDWGLSMELAQSDKQEPFTHATLERAALQAAIWCQVFDIPAVHLGHIQQDAPGPGAFGIVGHDELENGRKLGKTDPGALFPWPQFIARVQDVMHGTGSAIETALRLPHESVLAAIPLTFHRHNAGFVDVPLPLAGHVFNARRAFGLPDRARQVQLHLWPQDATTEARVYDGTPDVDNREAGRAFAPYGMVGPVLLGAEGEIFVTLAEGVASGRVRIAILGYWA
jgi:hypothetical protein